MREWNFSESHCTTRTVHKKINLLLAANYADMLQRIQSVYLAVAAISGIVALMNPVAIFLNNDQAVTLGAFTHTAPEGTDFIGAWPLGVLWVIVIAGLGATILQYKNRPFQMKLAMGSAILLVVISGIQFLLAYMLGTALGDSFSTNYGWVVILPFVATVLVVMAKVAVKKDENLVKSVDRLR